MAIPVTCACGQSYRLVDNLAGRKVRCKQCGAIMDVPAETLAAAQPAGPASDVAEPAAAEPASADRPKRRKKSRRGRATGSRYDSDSYPSSLEDRLRQRTDDAERRARPLRSIKYFVGGVILIALAILLFGYFAKWEVEGGVRRLNVIVALLYKVTGKWGTAIIIGALGLFSCVIGILNALGISVIVESDD